MGVLNDEQIISDVKKLLDMFETTQYKEHTIKPDLLKGPILTREGLRKIRMTTGVYHTKTSGSTGEPITVQKTYQDLIWSIATNIREIRWRGWDVTKNVAVIKATHPLATTPNWGISKEIEPIQGTSYTSPYKTISELQSWIEKVNPHYINCIPSIFKQLDLNKVSNFIDWKGTGEVGGTMYSTEECGTIAIQCPDNSSVMHVMENIYLEVDDDGGVIVTSMTNPYIKKYKHGDHVVMGKCHCGRTMQTITEVKGRVRNMFVLPNGDKKWPLIGSHHFYDKFGIKRFKAIQKSIYDLEFQIICEPLNELESELIKLIQDFLESDIIITITYVDEFKDYKFEEFISLI
jgi:phenylacetate-CoA ligase